MGACPWDAWDAGTVAFCEERRCAWVAEPANTVSSLGYVLIGAVLLRDAIRRRDPRLGAVAAAEIGIGLGSIAFHGSGTFAGEFLDQVGMFMLSCLILCFAAARQRGLSAGATAAAYGLAVAASSGLLLVFRPIGIGLFAIQLAVGLWGERWLYQRSADPAQFVDLRRGLLIFVVSFAFWVGDISGVLCDPQNHVFTGHSLWHLLNAVCIERLYRFYDRCFSG